MSPIKLGLFPGDVNPKSVVRIVFALVSCEAGANFRKARGRGLVVLIASLCSTSGLGLSMVVFKETDQDLGSYRALLQRSLWPHDAFELRDDLEVDDSHAGKEVLQLIGSILSRQSPIRS